MTFLHVQKVNDADFIALPFQQSAAVPEQLALTIQHKIRGVGLAQVDFCIEPAFSCAAAAHHQGVQIAAVLPAVQSHADVLGEDAVLKRVFRPVLLVHGSGVAPFGRTVFFAPSVIAPG